ncbi:hypothetical protein PsAD5_01263 [Pseudovibrio sp. Ad5]|uniref:hypothetical protein n=1 Tax=Pseudovibrio sp. Ad5 TaxID=989436 RepID=UPI0007AE3E54|nr:hypothetical protein [Pseudovibrio sp. Ad5]KZK99623.1 hypothetical protein PsAD5_01263 [Pseudovibrio sp. Ad5]
MRIPSNRNPNITAKINPNITARINPNITARLNPNITARINPYQASNIPGLFLFNRTLSAVGFTVEADQEVWLLFNSDCIFYAVAARVQENYFVIHDKDNNYIGFLVNADGSVWLQFDCNNNWIGSTT